MRQRWFGATRQRVAAIVVDGETEFPAEPLVLDEVTDTDRLGTAFDEGTPIVVRADTEEKVVAALQRPEVSAVLVPPQRRDLVDIDLVELTYGA